MTKHRKKHAKKKKAEKSSAEKILDFIWKDLHLFNTYAGTAYLRDEVAEMNFWKGQYIALERLRKYVADLVIQESTDD
jgi:hypothetical protein